MATVGQVIENPVTGETVTFQATREGTGGARLQFEVESRPQGAGPPEHVHVRSRETYDLVAGQLHVRIAGEERIVVAPERVEVPPGVAHTFWNEGPDTARLVVAFEPAGTFEHFLETVYGLAVDGRTNRKGVPNPLQMAVIARHHLDDIALARPPVAVQRAVFALLAPLGRLDRKSVV